MTCRNPPEKTKNSLKKVFTSKNFLFWLGSISLLVVVSGCTSSPHELTLGNNLVQDIELGYNKKCTVIANPVLDKRSQSDHLGHLDQRPIHANGSLRLIDKAFSHLESRNHPTSNPIILNGTVKKFYVDSITLQRVGAAVL